MPHDSTEARMQQADVDTAVHFRSVLQQQAFRRLSLCKAQAVNVYGNAAIAALEFNCLGP